MEEDAPQGLFFSFIFLRILSYGARCSYFFAFSRQVPVVAYPSRAHWMQSTELLKHLKAKMSKIINSVRTSKGSLMSDYYMSQSFAFVTCSLYSE